MPFNISGRKPRLLAVALGLGLAAVIASPAQAARGIANPYDCAPQPTLAQNFALFNDFGQYTPVPNAGFEQGATGWTLTGAARVVSGNEPWKIGGSWHRNALDLPGGSSAITAPICIDETYPHFRLFVRNAGPLSSPLKIEVLYYDTKGNITNTRPVEYRSLTTAWQPTGLVGINVFSSRTTVTAAPVAFRFTTIAKDARFQIDDVYVDPRARG
jgi:hypothetical protein